MKSISTYITEKIKISSNDLDHSYKYFPTTNKKLKKIIDKLVDEQSMEDVINLNSIDTSEIIDMSNLFDGMEGILKIDISKWDVSKVKNMNSMFKDCINLEKIVGIENFDVSNVTDIRAMFQNCKKFNQDISKWDISNISNTYCLFYGCKSFNQPLNDWNVSNVTDMRYMFRGCKLFNQPLDKWDISNVTHISYMFQKCSSFNQDISDWDVSNLFYVDDVFNECPIEKKYKPKRFR